MIDESVLTQLAAELDQISSAGLFKKEHAIESPQANRIRVDGVRNVLNLCANNYLGLADHPAIAEAARQSLRQRGYGMASVRFICGTLDIHKELEARLSRFLGLGDTILYTSCFDANGGLFETLLGPEDAVISDRLNHASIIDGIRLCKAKRYVYENNRVAELEERLREARNAGARRILVATDGVFSMDGIIADLPGICDAAEKHGAMVMVDDSHAVGFMGRHGRGTHEHHGVMDRVDIITGTLGKALGGASGGYTSGHPSIISLLRQRSRPYLFSNSVAPAIVAASLAVLDLLEDSTALRDRLEENTRYFRQGMEKTGLALKPGQHPIVPVMLGDSVVAQEFAARMLEKGVYVVGFFFPVVPKGEARIRTQVSAAHTREDLDYAISCFAEVKAEMGL